MQAPNHDQNKAGGKAWLMPFLLKGKLMLRVGIGAESTEGKHVEALWEALKAASSPV